MTKESFGMDELQDGVFYRVKPVYHVNPEYAVFVAARRLFIFLRERGDYRRLVEGDAVALQAIAVVPKDLKLTTHLDSDLDGLRLENGELKGWIERMTPKPRTKNDELETLVKAVNMANRTANWLTGQLNEIFRPLLYAKVCYTDTGNLVHGLAKRLVERIYPLVPPQVRIVHVAKPAGSYLYFEVYSIITCGEITRTATAEVTVGRLDEGVLDTLQHLDARIKCPLKDDYTVEWVTERQKTRRNALATAEQVTRELRPFEEESNDE